MSFELHLHFIRRCSKSVKAQQMMNDVILCED
jgi:hypothetical protein